MGSAGCRVVFRRAIFYFAGRQEKARGEEGEGYSDEDECVWPSPNGSGPVLEQPGTLLPLPTYTYGQQLYYVVVTYPNRVSFVPVTKICNSA